ncbi:MAG: PAC2 family protein [Acidimicrobiia bacterium]|nr:PAC2 family protein [Acidimicrobiia bacterium]
MEQLVWHEHPTLRRPVFIIAFEGWSDAGDAASSAVQFLSERWSARPVASIDAEEFFDFTETRPRVELDDAERRHIVWPPNELTAATVAGVDRDVVLLLGTEPQMRWKAFCRQITDVARTLDVSLVITLGALLAEVPHTRDTSVMGSSQDPGLQADLGLKASRYEGPAGITSVVHQACHDAGIPSAALWAAVPSYVPGAPSPKATLALVERAASMLGTSVPATDLEIATAAYERQLDELVQEDEETSGYVEQLEQRYDSDDSDEVTAQSLIDEVERFLRDHPGE